MSSAAIKRSLSSSPSPPVTPQKKLKGTKVTTKSPSTSGWTDEKKRIFAEYCMDLAYKNMDWAKLSAEIGMTPAQCKDQLKPGRSNIRKVFEDLFKKA